MKKISTLGVDLAKNDYQVCGMNQSGKVLFNRKLGRSKFIEFVCTLDIAADFHVAMEACGGANHVARVLTARGFTVKLMAPKFVKPYVKSNKNDRNDAEAIAEASRRPTMRFVGIKSMFQQEINAIHRVRENLVKRKTAISNEIRAMFFEFGVTIPKGITYTRKQVPLLLEDAELNIPLGVRELIRDLYQELLEVFDKVEKWDKKLQLIYKDNEVCSRIGKVEGVGVITATAIIGAVGDPQVFSCGREFAAYLGLTPRQHSTGGKNVLLGISKRGDSYIRKNLIHGARAVVSSPLKKESKRNSWVKDKLEKRGPNKAAVALANKNARVIWALMAKGEEYKAA